MEISAKQVGNDEFRDRALGCILGAFIGDASGANLEFVRGITKEKVQRGIRMTGGGPLQIGPGQITDDSELAMCLLQGLSGAKGKFNPDRICYYYGQWMRSPPFDIGTTTRNGLSKATSLTGNLSARCTKAAAHFRSESNGSTMRMSPLAVFASQIDSVEEIKKLIKMDTNHTHSQEIVVDCNVTLAIACKELLNGSTPEQSYKEARAYAMKSKVKQWMVEMESDRMQPVNRKIGWVKIAFQRSLFYLRENYQYEDALVDILSQGGDTDTNAAIVGMVLGARDGASGLNQKSVEKVLAWDNSKGGHKRPKFLIPKHSFMPAFESLIANITSEPEVEYGLDG